MNQCDIINHLNEDGRMGELSNRALRLLLAYAKHVYESPVIWPGLDTLSEHTKIHRSHLHAARAELIAAGWISIVKEGGGNKLETTWVEIHLPGKPAEKPSTKSAPGKQSTKSADGEARPSTDLAPRPSTDLAPQGSTDLVDQRTHRRTHSTTHGAAVEKILEEFGVGSKAAADIATKIQPIDALLGVREIAGMPGVRDKPAMLITKFREGWRPKITPRAIADLKSILTYDGRRVQGWNDHGIVLEGRSSRTPLRVGDLDRALFTIDLPSKVPKRKSA